MIPMRALAIALLVGASLCGCATAPTEVPPSLVTDMPPPSPGATASVSPMAMPGEYQLTAEEQKYDCRKLTGQMQIRILQIRGYDSRKKSSLAARGMQTVTTPIFGGTKEGLDPDGQYRKDLAQLKAFNKQLEAKKCKTFDLDAELSPGATDVTPAPRAPKKAN
jgi:hypothetical protein